VAPSFRGKLTDHIVGVVPGTVSDNQDPEKLYRVQVKYVVPGGDILSAWARVATLMGGPEMGFACLPEVDDEVLLRFINGNAHEPVVVGAVHNGKDKPPFDNADGKNDQRIFYSRNGHHLVVDDKDGSEHVTIESKDSKTKIEMLSADSHVKITAGADIVVKVGGTLTVEAGADLALEASASYAHMASSDLEMKSDGSVDWQGSAGVTLKGPTVDIKA